MQRHDGGDEYHREIRRVVDAFAAKQSSGQDVRIEECLNDVSKENRPTLLRELLKMDVVFRCDRNEAYTAQEYAERIPAFADQIREFFREQPAPTWLSPSDSSKDETTARAPKCESVTMDAGGSASRSHNPSGVGLSGAGSSRRVGPYYLVKPIGQGGMGSVWLARQEEPVQRTVALKVIKAGMDSKEVIVRFETERKSLALMDHPNIAKVLDAGTTDQGRPYFVMEFVDGPRITHFCNHSRMPLDERLRLFADVCRAVQHAHQRGIIHRDIKPSNVLVTRKDGRAIVKVIDFGLAKALTEKLTERSLQTEVGQMLGTPVYMSPEQATTENLDIDTRTDVYSLGVLLYELLTGTTPIEEKSLKQLSYLELQGMIKQQEAPAMSKRLRSHGDSSREIARLRGCDTRRLLQLLSGDLNVVVLKALEKDRTRRYNSPSDLADDLLRFMNNEPIEARPASTLYRMRKLYQRNRVAVTTSLVVCSAVLIGAAVSIMQAVRATKAERLAESRLTDVQAKARELSVAILRSDAQKEIADQNAKRAEVEAAAAVQANRDAQRALYNLYLTQVSSLRKPKPEVAAAVLSDENKCAPELRDFSWRLFQRSVSRARLAFQATPNAVDFSPDGKLLCLISPWASVIQVSDAEPLLQLHDSIFQSVFSADGRWLFTTSSADYAGVEVWDVQTGRLIKRLVTAEMRAFFIAASPDGRFVGATTGAAQDSGLEYKTTHVIVWDARSLEWVRTLSCRDLGPIALRFSDDGEQLAIPCRSSDVLLVDTGQLSSKDPVEFHVLNTSHSNWMTDAAFTPDGKSLIASGMWARVVRWNLEDRQVVDKAQGHPRTFALDISPDGKFLALAEDNIITIRHLDSLSTVVDTLRGHSDEIKRLRWSPSSDAIASSCQDGTFRLWDDLNLESRQGDPEKRVLIEGGSSVKAMVLDKNSQSLTVVSNDGAIRKLLLDRLAADAAGKADNTGLAVDRFTRSTDGTRLAFIADSELYVQGDGGEQLSSTQLSWPQLIRYLPDSHQILIVQSGNGWCKVRLMSEAGNLGDPLPCTQEESFAVNLTPDGKHLFLGFADETMERVDLEKRKSEFFCRLPNRPKVFAFSADSERLYVAHHNTTLSAWDTTTGARFAIGRGQDARSVAMAVSADGETLATADEGGKIYLWDADTLDLRGTLTGQGEKVNVLVFDGSDRLYSGGDDGTVIEWNGTWNPTLTGPVREIDRQRQLQNLTEAIDSNPEDTALLEARAALYHKLQQWDRFVKDAESLVDQHPNNREYLFQLADGYRQTGQLDLALKICHSILDLDPLNLDGIQYLAAVHQFRQEPMLSLEACTLGLEIDATNIELLSLRWKAFLQAEDWESALRDAQTICQANPNSGEVQFARAMLLVQTGRYDEYAAACEATLKLAEQQPYNSEITDRLLRIFCLHPALNVKLFDRVGRIAMKQTMGSNDASTAQRTLGMIFFVQQNHQYAVEQFEKATATAGENVVDVSYLAMAKHALDDVEQSRALLEQAIGLLESRDLDSLRRLEASLAMRAAAALIAPNRSIARLAPESSNATELPKPGDLLLAAIEKSLANASENADQSKQLDLYLKRALLYEKLGRSDEAENAWQRIEALGTGDIEKEWLAIVEDHQRWNGVARYYSRQIDKHPNGWFCHDSRSRLILEIIERDDPVFERLLELRPNDLLLSVCKGRALVMESRWTDAADYYARLEEDAPFSEAWYEYAAVLVLAGREQRYAETIRHVEELTRGTNSQTVGYSLARAATVAPAEVIPWETVIKWGVLGSSNNARGWNLHVEGLTQLRAGNLDKALELFAQSVDASWQPQLNALARCLTYQQQEEHELADQELDLAHEWLDQLQQNRPANYWPPDWLEFNVLLREAERNKESI